MRKGKVVSNKARSKAITERQAKGIADGQIFLREFNPDYNQMMKKISKYPTGLRNGAPPGTVT